jgi:hypothetical protein
MSIKRPERLFFARLPKTTSAVEREGFREFPGGKNDNRRAARFDNLSRDVSRVPAKKKLRKKQEITVKTNSFFAASSVNCEHV